VKVMFCEECGKETGANSKVCGNCGVAVPPSVPAAQISELVRARFHDALEAVKTIAANPVGGLPIAFQTFQKRQAMEVGIYFGLAFEICAVVGLYLVLPRWAGSPGFSDISKIFVLGLVPFAATAGACALARGTLSASSGHLEGDIFIAGSAVLPFGLVVFLAGILGPANFEIVAVACVFSLSYSILILYAGCTRISGISEERAVLAVPAIVLIAGWFSKILFAAML
jgi:hypothetical protein